MKILIISITDINRVVHNRIHEIVKTLSDLHEVTVWSMNAWYIGNKANTVTLPTEVHKIYFTDKRIHPVIQEVIQSKLLFDPKIDEYKLSDYDLIINYNTLLLPIIVKSTNKKIPLLFDLADDLPALFSSSTQIPSNLKDIIKTFMTRLLQLNVKISDVITVISPELATKYKLSKSKTLIIPNGVEVSLFEKKCNNTARKKIREKYGISDKVLVIGYVGVLEPWIELTNVFFSLKKISKIIPVKLMIVGEGSRLRQILSLAKIYNVSDKIIFTGQIEYKDVPEYISAFDIGLAPFRLNEITDTILPIKVLEYMACSKPVIASPLRSVTNSFGNNIIYAITPTDYLKAIKLLKNEEIREVLGREGKKIVESHYNWSLISKKFLALCEKIAKKR